MTRKLRTFHFEGEERTLTQIADQFFPGLSTGTLYSRLNASGAKSVAEYMAYMQKPNPLASKPNAEAKRIVHENVVNARNSRFSREVRAKTDALTGEKGCNYCRKMRLVKDLSAVKSNGSVRLICTWCKAARDQALSKHAPKSTNRGDRNNE